MKRKQKNQIQFFKNLLICTISLFLLITTIITLSRTFSLSQHVTQKQKQYDILQLEKKSLQESVKNLQNSDYVARYARDNYAYTREGEEVVKIPEKPINPNK